jgi:hypothetical protein
MTLACACGKRGNGQYAEPRFVKSTSILPSSTTHPLRAASEIVGDPLADWAG